MNNTGSAGGQGGRRNERRVNTASGQDALDAQLCTLLLNSDRLATTDMLASIAAKAGDPNVLREHLAAVAATLSGEPTHLRETLDDAGVSMDSLMAAATSVHSILAERLGDDNLSRSIGEECFRLQQPTAYQRIVAAVDYPATSRWLADVAMRLAEQTGVEVTAVEHRVKSPQSAWAKSGGDLARLLNLHDLLGVRLIVADTATCYEAISRIASRHDFDASGWRDYVARAKASGYSSLHIVVTEDARRVEVQVRTGGMHHDARFGRAAHWAYKLGSDGEPAWLSTVLAGNRLPDNVTVYTPAGQAIVLRRGACVIDFAYAIHSDVGATCVGASINGQVAALSTVLADGDTVEVRTGRRSGPNRDWLRWVVTPRVRTKIRRQLRDAEQMSPQTAEPAVGQPGPVRPKLPPPTGATGAAVTIPGADAMPFRLALCCSPAPTSPAGIVARGLRNGTLTVHRSDCVNVVDATNTVPASWA